MRRTVLSALIVVSGMVGLGSGAVAAFDAVSDPHRPARVQHSNDAWTTGIGAPKDAALNAGDPASVPQAPVPGGTQSEVPPSDDAATDVPAPEPDVVQLRTTGVLSDAFTELGIDDPTTLDVDESLPSPCTGLATVKNPVACVLR